MLATDERTEVDELLAMLDGEVACIVNAHTMFGIVIMPQQCERPARWITKLACGHPIVMCDRHMAETDAVQGVWHNACGAQRGPFAWMPL